MAKEATFKIYNGTSWEEYTFPPSTHTHSEYATNTRVNDLELAIGNKSRVTLNGSATTSPSFYAPTSAGTSGQVLVSNGSGAPKWESLDISSSGSTSCNQYYGTCSTGSSTTAKVVVCTGFTLTTGARISVKFTNYNTATSPTLNVNSTGAKAIKEYGTTASYMTYRWASGGVVGFVYDGTYWIIEQPRTATTTYYGLSRCDRVTLNGSTNASPSFYAPTSVGTAGQFLVSNGSGAPSWSNISNYLNTDNIQDVETGDDLTTTLIDLNDRLSDVESGGGSSGGSSVYTYITTLYLAVDEVVDISSYLSSYNDVLFNIEVSNDGTTTFGITNSTASWFNCGITTDVSFDSQIHVYKSTNKYMSPINMFSNINLTSCGSLDTYNNKYYIGNSTEEQGTSVEMIIQIYGR